MLRIVLHALAVIVFVANIPKVFAQAPQGIPYQAIARNSSGAILASTAISVRFTIRDSVAAGTIKYRETFSVTTTSQGMFSVNVGQGTPVTGTFTGINWGTNSKFMQVELDPAGGTSYIDMGTTQMMSVPYALNSGSLKLTVSATGDTLYSGGGNFVIIPGISAANCFVSVGAIAGSSSVGVGTTVTLSNAVSGGIWSSSNSAVAAVGSTGIVTGVTAGTAIISYTKTLACGTSRATLIVTVATLTVGMSYGGGIIGYILQSYDPGYIAGQTHGLIAATSDQSSGTTWGCYGTITGATATSTGTGSSNTTLILAACSTSGIAAQICRSYTGGGYTDWYLPSSNELSRLYYNASLIGGFNMYVCYWSSSECFSPYSNVYAFPVDFSGGGSTGRLKTFSYSVRAVRSF